MTVFLIK